MLTTIITMPAQSASDLRCLKCGSTEFDMTVIRKLAQATALMCGLSTTLLFVLAVFIPDSNPLINSVWRACAITGLVAYSLELWLRSIEKKESKAESERNQLAIALATQASAQANQRAAEARLALEKYKAPRTLTPIQQNAMREQLKKFSPQRLDVWVVGQTTEIAGIASFIISPLSEEGWDINETWPLGRAATGVLVATEAGSDAKTVAAANALIASLNSQGIATFSWKQFSASDQLPIAVARETSPKAIAPIRMIVGTKP
jgi:hypothetical protein